MNEDYNDINMINYKQYKTNNKEQSYIHVQDGEGTLISPDNLMQYKGQFKNGKKHGKGELIQILDALGNHKAIIKGNWKNGFLSGKALIFLTNQLNQFIPNQTQPIQLKYQDSFEGLFKKGQASGYGILKFSNGDSYQGSFKKCLKDGNGKYVSVIEQNNQYRVQGEFVENHIEGSCVIQYLNGHTYQGTVFCNSISGLGQLQFKNGINYEGNFHSNKFEGRGTLNIPMPLKLIKSTLSPLSTSPMNNSFQPSMTINTQNNGVQIFYYSGEFKQGLFHGKGKAIWPQNENQKYLLQYEGFFQNSKIDGGKGTFYFGPNLIHGFFKENKLAGQAYKRQNIDDKLQVIYKGELTVDTQLMDGFGELIWVNLKHKNQYIGEIHNDKIQGQGQLSFQDQYGGMAQYFGGMRDNLFYGKGELTFSNGDRYVGNFQNGHFEGSGSLTFMNDQMVYQGFFLNGCFHGRSTLKVQNQFIINGLFLNGQIDCNSNVLINFTNGDSYSGRVDHNYHFNGMGVYRNLAESYKLIGTFKEGVPHSYCKKVFHQIGNPLKIIRILYGFYNQAKINGNAIESIIDSDTGKVVAKNNQMFINGKLQKGNGQFRETFDENSLLNDLFYDSVERQCDFENIN
ncbi:UNKNOWN [Stylonychia lemnae]|uniref:Morn repeat protein n=1 Tax=Stylonychia lemnae TaxID=5949 RepID=A0A077ZQV3_STYLE|nr:UNKNOWN [Stylonychia lemnae]|eukprot:CDW71804.1 UNKNOWN [Stylonychia lemnae]